MLASRRVYQLYSAFMVIRRTGWPRVCAGLLCAVVLTGCQRGTRRADLSSRYPVDRARAIVHLADNGDIEAVHRLVDLLDDDDVAVRMYAILALERLCGETFGYDYYAPREARKAAIERWREALRQGRWQFHAREPIGMRLRRRADVSVAPAAICGGGHERC